MRREQILNVAAKEFSRNGFAGARTAEIASEADISERLKLHHIKSKEKIFIELIKMASVPIDILKYILKLNIKPLDKIRLYEILP
jgi:AcrR family transcriptional regulator